MRAGIPAGCAHTETRRRSQQAHSKQPHWPQPTCPSPDERRNRKWSLHTVEGRSCAAKDHSTTTLKNTFTTEARRQSLHGRTPPCALPTKDRFTQTEVR